MKHIIFVLLLVVIAGCAHESTTSDLTLTSQETKELGMTGNCSTENHETNERAPLAQTTRCNYAVSNDSSITVILSKYTNFHDLNGSYQYNSMHLASSKGIISENEYGDLSRFRVNHEDDYGPMDNETYYNLWIVKDLYLIHVTSKNVSEEKVLSVGKTILSKFE